jgi:hypothetical protein
MTKNKGGRPAIVLTSDQIIQVEALAAFLTIEDIAHYLGVSERTFHEIKNRNPEVSTAYKRGVAKIRAHVASKLMKQINNDNLAAIIFYLKTQAGWSEKQEMNVTTKDVTPQPPTFIYNFNNKMLNKPQEVKEVVDDTASNT